MKEKFELIKSLGFQGVELDSPSGVNKDEAVKAQAETGVKIHGVIDSVHWKERLSDPDPAVRAKGLAALNGAIADAKLYGADTVLLVPGKVHRPGERKLRAGLGALAGGDPQGDPRRAGRRASRSPSRSSGTTSSPSPSSS